MRSPASGLALLCALACGGDRAPSPDPGGEPVSDTAEVAVERGGTAVVGTAAAATTLLPPLSAAALDFELGGSLFLGLNYGEWEDGEFRYRPGHELSLSREWRLDAERATLTYALDTGKRWSDGRPVTAEDVVFTYGLLADTTLALPLSSTADRVDSVVARNDSTVVFHFDGAYPGMLFDTGVGLLPAHVYAPMPRERLTGGMPGLERPESLVVSGPLRLEEWRPTERITLARNPASASPARLDRVVLRVIPDEVTRATELRAGALDFAQLNSFRQARSLSEDGITIGRIPQRGYDYIAWNPGSHPAFDQPRARQALSLAIDREGLIAALDMEGFAEPAWGPYGSLFAALRGPPPREPLYDADAARRLLASAGWSDEDGDGVRERDGVELSFVLRYPAGNDRRAAAAEILQRSFAEVGARVEVRQEEFNALMGRAFAREYEAVLLGWQVGLEPDISMFWRDPASPLNVVAFEDVATQAQVDSALARRSHEEAGPYWRRAGESIAAAYPYAFLWYFDLPVAVGPRLRGVDVGVTGWGPGLYRWWIAAGVRRGSG